VKPKAGDRFVVIANSSWLGCRGTITRVARGNGNAVDALMDGTSARTDSWWTREIRLLDPVERLAELA
jgi:hypothetical protein